MLTPSETTIDQFDQKSIPQKSLDLENGHANSNLINGFNFKNHSKSLFYLHDGSIISYGQFEKRVSAYGSYLIDQLHVIKGHRLAAQVNKSPDSIALYLATLRVGAVYVPLNTDYKLDEIRYFIQNSQPTVFVCRNGDKSSYQQMIDSDHGRCTVIDEFELAARVTDHVTSHVTNDESEPAARVTDHVTNGHMGHVTNGHVIEHVDPDDLAAICYTSGTTGKPKGAMITHGNLLSNTKALCETWRMTDQDVLLHALPIYHVHGLMVALNTILLNGASAILLPKFDTDLILDWLPKSTLMMGVPTYYTRLLQCAKFKSDCIRNVRLFISGSAPLLENTWNEFKERTGHEVLERYGMTEGQMVCSNPYDGKRKPGTVGRSLPLVAVRIRNGGLEYKGPNLFRGYWRMPEKTREDFTEDGYFISGDLAELDEDGYVRILGRRKDLIITGGLNVYPKEVENVIDQLQGVFESAVIGAPHPDFGEAVVACVVTKDSSDQDESSGDEIMRTLKLKMAGFKVPKRVIILKQLPRNAMGKVQKNILRDQYKHIFEN